MATIRRIVTYKIYINKQVKHTNVNNKAGTVYSIIQFNLSYRLESCTACRRCLDRVASNVHLTKMRSGPLIRCLPKMSPSSSTSTGSQIATWRRSLTWTRHDFSHNLRSLLTGKMFVWLPAFLSEPGSARYASAPSITTVWSNYQTSYNDFFEVYNSNTVTLSPIIQMVFKTRGPILKSS